MTKKLFLPALTVSCSIILFSFAKVSQPTTTVLSMSSTPAVAHASAVSGNEVALSTVLYNELHLSEAGLSPESVACAISGYQKLDAAGKVNNPFLTIVDLSQSSRKKRFYIIDMNARKLVWNTYVAHGKNSGLDMAEHFSNRSNSEASSLGFYLTAGTYTGKHGLSLRISGQERGFNDNAEARGVVVHGAAYVNAARATSAYMGRSQGCPALPEGEYAQVIRIIKGGSVLFVYHPAADYLAGSALVRS